MRGTGAVLVGTDGSPTSLRAVTTAARLAEARGRDLVVVTAYRDPRRAGLRPVLPRLPTGRWVISPAAAGEATLAASLAEARACLPDWWPVRGRSEAGEPAAVLLAAATELDASMVVLGNVGTDGWAARWSVPRRVARRAPCEVLVIDTTGLTRGADPSNV